MGAEQLPPPPLAFASYQLQAAVSWLLDSGFTPHILVDLKVDGVQVPPQFHGQDTIIFNLAPNALVNFSAQPDWVSFSARFNGQSHEIWLPTHSVRVVFAKENGMGMELSHLNPTTSALQPAKTGPEALLPQEAVDRKFRPTAVPPASPRPQLSGATTAPVPTTAAPGGTVGKDGVWVPRRYGHLTSMK